MKTYWLTKDCVEYCLWESEPHRNECGVVWTGAGCITSQDDTGGVILPHFCRSNERPYRVTVRGSDLWITWDQDGYALWLYEPAEVRGRRRKWTGEMLARGDDDILAALVEDGGCVRVSV